MTYLPVPSGRLPGRMRTCAAFSAGMLAKLNSSQLCRHTGDWDWDDQCCRPLLFSYRNSVPGSTGCHVAGTSAAYENQFLQSSSFCEIWGFWSLFPLITFIALEKCEKECSMLEIILVQGFCPLKIKITQFPNGFCLKSLPFFIYPLLISLAI